MAGLLLFLSISIIASSANSNAIDLFFVFSCLADSGLDRVRLWKIRDASVRNGVRLFFGHMADDPQNDPRVYFAAERTLLAWLRTGLALMGVGFAVARFGLFLRQMQATETHGPVHSSGLSVWSGVALVGLGVVVNVGAMGRHLQLTRELMSDRWRPGVSTHGVALAATLAVIGVAMAVYLVLMR